MTHRLTTLLSGDEELFLGEFDDLYKAVECAENDFLNHTIFRICEGENCLVGVRIGFKIREVFWRIPREEKIRGRDSWVMNLVDNVISKFKER